MHYMWFVEQSLLCCVWWRKKLAFRKWGGRSEMTAGDCTWLRNCRKLKWVVGVVTFYSIHHRNIHPTRLRVTSDYVSSVWLLAEWGKMGERPSQWGRNWKAIMILLLSDFEENSRSFHGSWSWKSHHFFAHVSHDAALSCAREFIDNS